MQLKLLLFQELSYTILDESESFIGKYTNVLLQGFHLYSPIYIFLTSDIVTSLPLLNVPVH